jgi:hypothetical protein
MLDRVFDNWCNDAALLLDWRDRPPRSTSVAGEFVHFAGPFFVLNLAHGNPIIIETNTLAGPGGRRRTTARHRSSARSSAGRQRCRRPPDSGARCQRSGAQVRERLLGVLLSQTVDILDRGIGTAADLDLGCRVALGFRTRAAGADARHWAIPRCSAVLARFAHARPGMPMPLPCAGAVPAGRTPLCWWIPHRSTWSVITLRRPAGAQCAARRDDRRDPGGDPPRRGRPAGHRLRDRRIRHQRRFAPVPTSAASRACSVTTVAAAAVCARLLAPAGAPGPLRQAGGGGAERHGAGRRFRACDALPRAGGRSGRLDAVARDLAGDRAGHRRHGRAVPALAAGGRWFCTAC